MLGAGEARGEVDPMLVGVGTGSLHGERTKSSPPCRASRAGARWLRTHGFPFSFLFSFLSVSRVGARRADALLVPFFSFLRVARVGGSVCGHAAGVERPGASSLDLLMTITNEKNNSLRR